MQNDALLGDFFQPGFNPLELGSVVGLLNARPYLNAFITLFRGGEDEVLVRLFQLGIDLPECFFGMRMRKTTVVVEAMPLLVVQHQVLLAVGLTRSNTCQRSSDGNGVVKDSKRVDHHQRRSASLHRQASLVRSDDERSRSIF